jgi:hypothetical protein
MRDYQLSIGIPREQVYNQTMYILVGMLVVGLVCNLLVKPLDKKHFMSDEELAHEKKLAHERAAADDIGHGNASVMHQGNSGLALLAWAAVGIPLAWGVYRTALSVGKFFN